MDTHTGREDPHSVNVICEPTSAGKYVALLEWELRCKREINIILPRNLVC